MRVCKLIYRVGEKAKPLTSVLIAQFSGPSQMNRLQELIESAHCGGQRSKTVVNILP
jgi:hypothetical protein